MYPFASPRWITLCLALTAAIAGCGGGGSTSLAVGGTSGSGLPGSGSDTGVTGGSVNGFGSVVVNGTTYRTSTDDADIDTEFVGPFASFGEADLSPGMLVQVNWERTENGEPRRARRIVYLPELSGPLTAGLTPAAAGEPARLSVAGRTVEITTTTVVDDPYARATAGVAAVDDPAQFDPGVDRLEVSGFLVAAAEGGGSVIRASRIARTGQEDATDPQEVVTGFVHASGSTTFEIADASGAILVVSFDPVAVRDDDLLQPGAPGRLREGAAVRVTGQFQDGQMQRVDVIRRPLDGLEPISGDEAVAGEIEGPVSAVPDAGNEFRVGRQPVRFDAATEFSGGTADDLDLGLRVTVEGTLAAGDAGLRVLDAAEIRLAPEAEISLEDTVAEALSAPMAQGERSFVTRIGITVLVRAQTLLKDDRGESPDGRLELAALTVGDLVTVDGFFDDQGRLVAVTLERDDAADECELEAPVQGSELISGGRRYTIAGRPGLVVEDAGEDATAEKVAAGGFGEFEGGDGGSCSIRPTGVDVNGEPVDAGFLAGEVAPEDAPGDGDDDG